MKLDGFTLVAELGSAALRHNGGIRGVRVAPDGKRIYSIGDGVDVHVWDSMTGARLFDLRGTDRGLYALAISPDGRRVFAGGHQAQVFEVATRKHSTLPVKKPLVVAAAFAPDNSIIFGDDRVPRRFDARGGELPALKGHQSRIDAIAISRDGRRVLTCGGDAKIKLHALDRVQPEVVATWEGHGRSCGFSPDGTLVWSVGWSHAVVRGTSTGKAMFQPEPLPGMRCGAMSVDGTRFAIAADEAVHIYAIPGGKPLARIAYAGADTISFSPDGKRLVVANDGRGMGEGCGITVFDVDAETRVLPADTGHTGAIEALAVARDMPHALFSFGADGVIALWDVETRTAHAIERIGSIVGQGKALACTAGGGTLVTGSDRGELHAWNVARTEAARFDIQGRSSVAVAISPDEKHVAYAPYMPGQVHVFELASRARVATVGAHRAQMCDVAWLAPDVVVSSSADETVVASRLPTGERVWTASCSGFVNAICVAGDLVFAGTSYGQLSLLDAATGTSRGVLRASGREVLLARTVDAEHVAVVRRADDFESSVVELWSLHLRSIVAVADLTELRDQARSLAASPDGKRVYVGTNASRVLVFERSSH